MISDNSSSGIPSAELSKLLLKAAFLVGASIILTAISQSFLWQEIVRVYPELSSYSMGGFFSPALLFNLAVALLPLLFLGVAHLLFPPAEKVILFLWGAVVLVVFWIQASHVNFFQVMEVPFSDSIMGAGISTYTTEVMTSSLQEITSEFVTLIAGGTAGFFFTLAGLIFFIKRVEKGKGRFPIGSVVLSLLAVIILVSSFSFFRFFTHHEVQSLENAGGMSINVEQLRQDPVVTLFALLTGEGRSKEPGLTLESNKSHLGYDMNTDSEKFRRFFKSLNLKHKKYNIVFYFFESAATSSMGQKYRGKPVTPIWESLKNQSFVSLNHYSNYPLSVNAMHSVLSSSYDPPGKWYITNLAPDIKQEDISQVLKKKGYRTGLIHTGNLKNFEHHKYIMHRAYDMVLDIATLDHSEYKKIFSWAADDRVMIKPAVNFAKKGKSPFFLALFPLWPHHPYDAPEKRFRITDFELKHSKVSRKKEMWLNYLNSLNYADHVLGMTIAAFKKAGLLENTIFFIFSDHGEAFYQHRQNYLHSLFIYDVNTRVPLLIYNPVLFPKGKVYQGISRHIDIAPTALNLCGIAKPQSMQGISLVSSHRKQLALLHTFWKDEYMGIRDGRWKFIYRIKDRRKELYDVTEDSWELKNLAKEHPELVKYYLAKVKKLAAQKRNYYKKYLHRNITGN